MPWYSYSQEVAWPVEQKDLVALEKERVVRACIRSVARIRARAEQAGLGVRVQELVERVAREGAETVWATTRGYDSAQGNDSRRVNDSARGNDSCGAGGTVPLSLSERRLFARWTCYEAYATSPACPTPRDETPEDCTNASDPDPPAASQSINHSVELWEANGPPTPPSTPPQPEGAPPSPPLTPPGQGADASFRPGCFACSDAEQRDGKKPVPSPGGRGFGRTAETNTRAQTLIVSIEPESEVGPAKGDVRVRSGRVIKA